MALLWTQGIHVTLSWWLVAEGLQSQDFVWKCPKEHPVPSNFWLNNQLSKFCSIALTLRYLGLILDTAQDRTLMTIRSWTHPQFTSSLGFRASWWIPLRQFLFPSLTPDLFNPTSSRGGTSKSNLWIAQMLLYSQTKLSLAWHALKLWKSFLHRTWNMVTTDTNLTGRVRLYNFLTIQRPGPHRSWESHFSILQLRVLGLSLQHWTSLLQVQSQSTVRQCHKSGLHNSSRGHQKIINPKRNKCVGRKRAFQLMGRKHAFQIS